MPSEKVAYIVVAYRSAHLISACLDAIQADRGQHNWPIVVVDNASPDDSARIAELHPANPTVVHAERNQGFGAACNLAVSCLDAEIAFLVNPDAELSPGTTNTLMAELVGSARVGVVAPSVVGDTAGVEAAGWEPSGRSAVGHFLLLGRIPGIRRLTPPMQLPRPTGHRARDVDWVGGAALMVRVDLFRAIGGFDESMFLYMEDVDLCRRVRAAGWRVRFVPSAHVHHAMGGSQGAEQLDTWYAAFDRYVRLHHGRAAARIAGAAAVIGMEARSVAYALGPKRPTDAQRMRRGAAAAARRLFRG